MKKLYKNENMDSNSKNLLSTPIRKKRKSTIPISAVYGSSPIMNTPKGTQIRHPFIIHIMNNLDKPFTSPDMFNQNREYPQRDSNMLSPDLVGILFPTKINMNVEAQHQFEENFFREHQQLMDQKSAQFFTEHIMMETPEPQDSGIGKSLAVSEASAIDAEHSHGSLSIFQTPPSKFKWNRPEYQDTSEDSCYQNASHMSFDDDYFLAQLTVKNNFESTQLDINKATLADNVSMRQQSIIGSPMFLDDKSFSFSIEGAQMEAFPRSSPFSKFNCSAMNDLNLSPIKHCNFEDSDADEESM